MAKDETKTEESKGNNKQVKKLMRALKSPKDQHNPLPPTQHKWMLDEGPILHRIWAWLVDHTLAWNSAKYTEDYGRRSPHASNRQGKVLKLAQMALDLEIDLANLRQYWAAGVERGIWRNGLEDHEHEDGLYLCGEVPDSTEIKASKPDPKVCTYLWEKLPPYLVSEIRKLPPEKLHEFSIGYEVRAKVTNELEAEAMAAARLESEQIHDSWFSRFGIGKKKNKPHERKEPTDFPPDEREQRIQRLRQRLKRVVPDLERYVRTLPTSVQAASESQYTPEKTAVQTTPPYTEPSELSETPASVPALNAPAPPLVSSPSHQGQRVEYLPAAETAISEWLRKPESTPLPHLSADAAKAVCEKYVEASQTFFFHLSSVKEWSQDPAFVQFSEDRNVDQIFVARLILITGAGRDPAAAIQFISEVAAKFHGIGKGAMGKRPRSPQDPGGPRTFGLFINWARDFALANPLAEATNA